MKTRQHFRSYFHETRSALYTVILNLCHRSNIARTRLVREHLPLDVPACGGVVLRSEWRVMTAAHIGRIGARGRNPPRVTVSRTLRLTPDRFTVYESLRADTKSGFAEEIIGTLCDPRRPMRRKESAQPTATCGCKKSRATHRERAGRAKREREGSRSV